MPISSQAVVYHGRGDMAKKVLRKLSAGKVTTFKLRNRRGYAAICMNNLTEGNTENIALARMAKAVKRMGYLLS